jgi:hypothetical protein
MGLSRPVVGLSRPVMGLSRPVVELSRPVMGLSRPVVGLSRLVMGLSRPVMGLSRPVMGLLYLLHKNMPNTEAIIFVKFLISIVIKSHTPRKEHLPTIVDPVLCLKQRRSEHTFRSPQNSRSSRYPLLSSDTLQ